MGKMILRALLFSMLDTALDMICANKANIKGWEVTSNRDTQGKLTSLCVTRKVQ